MGFKTVRFGGKEFKIDGASSGHITRRDRGVIGGLKIIPLLAICQRSKREGKNVAFSGYPRGDIARYLVAGLCRRCALMGYDETIAESY